MFDQQITRQKFSTPLVCPDCGQTGVVLWEKGRPRSRKITLLSSGFREAPFQAPCGDPQIVCDLCDGLVEG